MAFKLMPLDTEVAALQRTCVAEYLPEIVLEPVSDLLVLPAP